MKGIITILFAFLVIGSNAQNKLGHIVQWLAHFDNHSIEHIVKGGDYDAEISDPTDKRYIVGKNEVESWGGKAQTIPLVDGYSTTGLLAKS